MNTTNSNHFNLVFCTLTALRTACDASITAHSALAQKKVGQGHKIRCVQMIQSNPETLQLEEIAFDRSSHV